jgi:pSer/pThr/pTyr-binding forkhead associated (FHA) protein
MPPNFDAPHPGPLTSPARSAALAHLVLQDANSTRLAITKTASRIGRRADNDIVFSNDSVSGHHAELHMGRDGSFTITDLGSGNGILINGSRVTQSTLRDGDTVELGEVRFRFSVAG